MIDQGPSPPAGPPAQRRALVLWPEPIAPVTPTDDPDLLRRVADGLRALDTSRPPTTRPTSAPEPAAAPTTPRRTSA